MNETTKLPYGPLMIDIAGLELTDLERERLKHPLVGGLILFARNYKSKEQLRRLTSEVHALRSPPLLIAIDHEGGRVQRCREEFTRLPPMRRLGELWEKNPQQAKAAARDIGYVLAAELRTCGVDLSFTPVLDIDWGRSGVIGDRAFHGDPEVVIALASALIEGLHQAGMAACGKHFPGHSWAEADSHVAFPVDERSLEELAPDIEPFYRLKLNGVMPAHVIYPEFDIKPAGFSKAWISFLRNDIKFNGVVFSDDLSMEAASFAGDIVSRASAAWEAGCYMLLACNAPDAVADLLQRWHPEDDPLRSARIAGLVPTDVVPKLADDPQYLAGIEAANMLI